MSEDRTEAPAALELKGISKAYNRGSASQVDVLRGLDLSLNPGEVVALVAPSGAGKSTLLHIAGLLDTPDAGSLSIAGQEVIGLGEGSRTRLRRRDIGFVYQFHHLLPEFSAAENIILPQLANGASQKQAMVRAKELLELVGLSARSAHRPAELSGGEQQRVAFCRALANQPSILLADEPTGNLDPGTSDQVFEVLMNLVRSSNLAALIATHNLELAARMDRVLRLENGVVTQADPV
jgi:lipoprotein-releasing system ATP-binding protein